MKILYLFLGMVFFSSVLSAEHLVEYDYEADAYYSNVSAFIDLDPNQEITNAINLSEQEIYTKLLLNTFSPNIALFEASFHPMSLAGMYFRNKEEGLYDKSNIENFNLVKAVTAGYEEPYSLSFFIGRMMIFKNKESDEIGKNRAYMGYLVTIGDYSIKDNLAHYNKWLNIEFKLKGTRNREDSDLDWSFRVGTKINNNNNFVNTFYMGARRSSVDYKKTVWSFVHNSAFSTLFAVSADTFRLTDTEVILEKKWPLSWSKKISFGLGLGYLYNSGEKYTGALSDEGINNHQLILRPNFTW